MSPRRTARTASTTDTTSHRLNTTEAEASGGPPNENTPPRINAKTPVVIAAPAMVVDYP
jgi:hypothetical protein